MPETEGVTLRQALLNQYQLILAGGAVGLVVLSGALWPALVFLGLECVTLPFVVGNRRLANALAMRRAPALGAAPAEAVLEPSALDAGGQKRFDELHWLVGYVDRNYRTRV